MKENCVFYDSCRLPSHTCNAKCKMFIDEKTTDESEFIKLYLTVHVSELKNHSIEILDKWRKGQQIYLNVRQERGVEK